MVFENYDRHPLATAIARLEVANQRKGVGRALATLITKKNDYKRDRGPRITEEFERETEDVLRTLNESLAALSFLGDHPLRLVEDFNVSRDGHFFEVTCIQYVGDYPALPQERIQLETPVRKEDLYLEIRPGHWVSLFPYLQVLNCPTCKRREVFFIDRWDTKRGRLGLKSFERGHTREASSEAVDVLDTWQPGPSK